ncbi:MAG: adenylate/guanylate cyclase domain-containing protein [Oligoflexales bacterium]|nr:adenylate/guanylate cyclase domain-containing protein [Oligoflexales bacterium]
MIADRISNTTILFADIVGFTKLTESMGAEPIVALLNKLFSYYDDLAGKYGLEKIKTIGDAYMVAAGVPKPSQRHGDQIAEMALEMMSYTEKVAKESGMDIRLRFGINSGTVIAGVIGKRKFQFDIWGDCVNTASRMESSGVAGKIQVSESTFELLKDNWSLGPRGYTEIKGLGKRKTWFLTGAKSTLENVA